MQGGYPPGGHGPYGPPGPPGHPPHGGPPGFVPPSPPAGGPFAPGPMVPAHPGAPFGVHPTLGRPYSDKTKLIAGLLQILVGFGVGRYYTGHTGLAIAQTVACGFGIFILSWFTCGLSAFVVFWTLIDGIVLLATDSTDEHGRLLR